MAVTDVSLPYAGSQPVDEVYSDGDSLALANGVAGAFVKSVKRQATSIVVFGSQPFNLSIAGPAAPIAQTAGVALVPAGVAVRIGLELDQDAAISIANVGAAAGVFGLLVFRRRRRQPRLPGVE